MIHIIIIFLRVLRAALDGKFYPLTLLKLQC